MSWEWTAETRERLEAFLTERGLMDGAPTITRIGEGHSNLTVLLQHGDTRLVLRRPPPPPIAPGGNDVLREARLLTALGSSGLPIPQVLATGQVGEVFDAPFFVMTWVDGHVITDVPPAALAGETPAAAMGAALVDTLADLHAVDWRAAGLSDFGKPEGFNRRHLRRVASLAHGDDGALPAAFVPLYEWLDANVPEESGATIVHNDYRIGNVMWSKTAPARLAAVLDWELTTIGDPLFDLAYLMASIPAPGETPTPTQAMSLAALAPGFPSPGALAERYAERTGRRIGRLDWYLAMVNWKLAAMYAFSRRRGHDPYFDPPERVERFLAEAARFSQRRAVRRASSNSAKTHACRAADFSAKA